jgi:hypothetical protein
MGTVMTYAGWGAIIAGSLSVLFNSLAYIKNLNDAGTAKTARELFGNTEQMKQNATDGLTGAMSIVEGVGAVKMGPVMKSGNFIKNIPKSPGALFKNTLEGAKDGLGAVKNIPGNVVKGAKKLFASGKKGLLELKDKIKKFFKGAPDVDAPHATTPVSKNGPNIDAPEAPRNIKSTKPDGTPLDDFQGRKVKAETEFPDGHKGKVLDNGECVICSNCEKIRGKFKKELDADPELDARLKKLENDIKNAPDADKSKLMAEQKKIHDDLMYRQQADLMPKVNEMEKRIKSGDRTITKKEFEDHHRNKRKLEGTRRDLNVPQKGTPFQPLTPKQKANLKKKLKDRTITKQEYQQLQWDRRFSNRRKKGVDRFWSNERRKLKNGEPGSRNWTPEQKADILNGKTPKFKNKPMEGHHRYNALDHPQIADDPLNIYGATNDEHFSRWHGDNYRNDTFGFPLKEGFDEQF